MSDIFKTRLYIDVKALNINTLTLIIMKKTLFIIGLFISLATITNAKPLPGVTYNSVRLLLQSYGYGIGQEWSCPLEQGEYFTKTFTFDAGVQYDIVALSEDMDVTDVDIEILTPDGYEYDKDTSTDRFAEVNFTPSYTRTLTIKVKNYSSNTPNYGSKVYFMIGYK